MKTEEKEVIEVQHNPYDDDDPKANEKRFSYSFGDYMIYVDINAEDGYYPGMCIQFWNKRVDEPGGVRIRAKRRNNKLVFSIDHTDGCTETSERDYEGWLQLERLNAAVKILGTALNKP